MSKQIFNFQVGAKIQRTILFMSRNLLCDLCGIVMSCSRLNPWHDNDGNMSTVVMCPSRVRVFPLVAVVGVDGHICEQCSSRLRHPRGTESVHKVFLAELRHVVRITCLCRIISAGVLRPLALRNRGSPLLPWLPASLYYLLS